MQVNDYIHTNLEHVGPQKSICDGCGGIFNSTETRPCVQCGEPICRATYRKCVMMHRRKGHFATGYNPDNVRVGG